MIKSYSQAKDVKVSKIQKRQQMYSKFNAKIPSQSNNIDIVDELTNPDMKEKSGRGSTGSTLVQNSKVWMQMEREMNQKDGV